MEDKEQILWRFQNAMYTMNDGIVFIATVSIESNIICGKGNSEMKL